MKKSIKILCMTMVLVMMVVCFSACGEDPSTAEQAQTQKTDQAANQVNKEIGMPNITNFTEKKLLKQVYELRDKSNLICYAYVMNSMDGKLVYQGKCMGYGLPYSTEYTNPQKVAYTSSYGVATLPQQDPNQLYAPTSADATWLVMIGDDGKQSVEYCEPNVIVSQTKKPARLCESWSLPSNY